MNLLDISRSTACILGCASLLACGGGGGGGGGGTSGGATIDGRPAQGFWSAQVDAQTTIAAIYLPDGVSWTVTQGSAGATTMARGTLSLGTGTFGVSGQSYNLATDVASPYSISGTLAEKATLTVAASGGMPGYTMNYNKAYETAASAADVTGRWTATRGGGTVRITLDVAANGALGGSTTNGCTYAGTLAPHPAGIAVFNLAMTESCVGQTARTLAGIGTVNAARTGLSLAFTTTDLTQGSVIQATRAP